MIEVVSYIGSLQEELESEHEGQGITPEWHAQRVSDLARQYAADPRFTHLNRDAAWWQSLLDQDERARDKGVRG